MFDHLHVLALAAGWTQTVTRRGRTYFVTTAGKSAWTDTDTGTVSAGFWFLANTVPAEA